MSVMYKMAPGHVLVTQWDTVITNTCFSHWAGAVFQSEQLISKQAPAPALSFSYALGLYVP